MATLLRPRQVGQLQGGRFHREEGGVLVPVPYAMPVGISIVLNSIGLGAEKELKSDREGPAAAASWGWGLTLP